MVIDESHNLRNDKSSRYKFLVDNILQKNKEFFERMPNGIFTGFKSIPDKQYPELHDGIIALLGYPAKPDEADIHIYDSVDLLASQKN